MHQNLSVTMQLNFSLYKRYALVDYHAVNFSLYKRYAPKLVSYHAVKLLFI